MPDAMSLVEIDEQYAELLPPRTVMSLFTTDNSTSTGTGTPPTGTTQTASSGLCTMEPFNTLPECAAK